MDLDIFNIKHNTTPPQIGRILLSVPFVDDTFFNKSVVYLVAHDEENTIGYILNKPLPMKLHELVEGIPESDFEVHIGGPVDHSTLNVLHTLGNKIPESIEVGNGVYWGGDFDYIREMIKRNELTKNYIRFFLGYSGWSPNQLNEEVEGDTWLVTNITTEALMSSFDEKLWERTLKQMGDKYKVWAELPSSPSLN